MSSNRAPRILFVLAGLLAISLAVVLLAHDHGDKAALTRYKAALLAKGEKLTLAELAAPYSTKPEQLASRRVFFTNNFAAPTNLVRATEITGPGRVEVSWRGTLRVDPTPGTIPNGSISDWASLERQNQFMADAVESFRQALNDPAPDGWNCEHTRYDAVAPKMNYAGERNVANAFLNFELAALHRGDLDGTISWLHALAGLAELNRNELTLVQGMIRTVIAESGLRGTWEALQAPGWDDQKLAAVQHDWEQVDLIGAAEQGFVGERAHNQEFMRKVHNANGREFNNLFTFSATTTNGTSTGMMSRPGLWLPMIWQTGLAPSVYKFYYMNEDELFMLDYYSRQLDIVRLLKSNRPWPEVHAADAALFKELSAKLNSATSEKYKVARIAIPNYSLVLLRTIHTETLRRLAITAITLKRYQIKHGSPPADLAALTPEFLSTVPIDPMSGEALCYRLKSDGTFLLYSTGEDGKDDGGDPTPREAGGKFGLWEGRDAVWPVAATREEEEAAEAALKRQSEAH